MALMNHYNDALKLEQKETDSAGSAMARYGTYAQSTKAKIDDLRGSIQRFWEQTINSSQINSAIDELNKLVNGFSSLTNRFGLIPTLLSAIVPILTQFKKFSDFKPIDFTSSIGSIRMFGKEIVNLCDNQGKITILGNTISELGTKIKNLPTTYLDSYSKNLKDIQELNDTWYKQPTLIEKVNASMRTLKVTTLATAAATGVLKVAEIALNAALTMGISLAIGYVIQKLQEYIDKVDTLKEKNKELISSTNQEIQTHQSNIQTLSDMAGKYEEVYNRVQTYKNNGLQPTTEDTKSLNDMNDQLAQKFPDLVTGYDSQGHAILDLNGNLQTLIDKEKEASRWSAQKVINSSGFKDESEAETKENQLRIRNLTDKTTLKDAFVSLSHPIQYIQDISASKSQSASMVKQLNKENAEATNWYKQIIPYILQVNTAYSKLNPTLQTTIKNWANQNTAFGKMKGTDVQKQVNEVVKMYSDTKGTLPLINQLNKVNDQAKKGAVPLKEYTKQTDNLINSIKKTSGTNLSTSQLKKLFNIDTSKSVSYTHLTLPTICSV